MKHLFHFIWLVAVLVAYFVGRGDRGDASLEVAEVERRSTEEKRSSSLTALTSTKSAEVASESAITELRDVQGALQEVLQLTDPLKRRQRIAEILAGLNEENVMEALAAFEAGPRGAEHDREFRQFLNAWGRIDGAAAMAYAMDQDSARRDHYGGTSVISGWATEDSDSAKDYLSDVDNEHSKEWLHYGVVQGMMVDDLDQAVAFSEENKLGRARGRQMDLLADRFNQVGGSEALIEWVQKIDHTGENDRLAYKRYAARAAVRRIGGNDLDVAEDWVRENISEPFVSGDTVASIARMGNRNTNEERLDWTVQLPDGDGRAEAVQIEMRDWAERDANGASEWLVQNEQNPEYDSAVGGFVRQIQREDPAAAVEWAMQINDVAERDQASRAVMERWQRSQPEAAAAWLSGNAGRLPSGAGTRERSATPQTGAGKAAPVAR